MSKKKSFHGVYAYITIGLELALSILVLVIIGHHLDKHFNTSPLYLAIGTVLGMVVGFYHLLKKLQVIDKKEKEKKNETKKKVKWM